MSNIYDLYFDIVWKLNDGATGENIDGIGLKSVFSVRSWPNIDDRYFLWKID